MTTSCSSSDSSHRQQTSQPMTEISRTSQIGSRCAGSPGLSTELADITEVEYRQLLLERVVLVSVWTNGNEVTAENSIAELKALAETAGSQVLEGLIQRRDRPDPATYIGRGKVDELRDVVVATGADTVICDGELTLAQLRNLEDRVRRQGHRPDRADPRHLRGARQER